MTDEPTRFRMEKPTPGDLFDEHCTFWMQVLSVENGVTVAELKPVNPVEQDAQGRYAYEWVPRHFPDAKAFRKAYAYNGIPGYWITYSKTARLVIPAVSVTVEARP